MNKITIEYMTDVYIPEVSKIVIEAFNKPPVNESWTKETSTQHLKEELNSEFSFVAIEDGIVIGALVGNISTIDTGPAYYIDILAVKEEKRGRSIGEQLVNKAVEIGKKHNLTLIALESGPKLRAFEWYKRLGFKESGWVELEKTLV